MASSHEGEWEPEPTPALEVTASVDRYPIDPALEVLQVAAALEVAENPDIDFLGCILGIRHIAEKEKGRFHNLRLDACDYPVECLPISLQRFPEVVLEVCPRRLVCRHEPSHVLHY